MNICIISCTFLPELTGVGIHLMNMLQHYSEMGHNVLLLCPDYSIESGIFPDYSQYQGEIFKNVFVRPIPTEKNPLRADKVEYKHWTEWNLEDYIGDFKPDVIDIEDPGRIYGLHMFGMHKTKSYDKAIAVDYARKNSIPTIGFYHTNYPAFSNCVIPEHVPTPYRSNGKEVYKEIYASYDIILCSCQDAYNHLKEHGLDSVKHGVFVGINDDIFRISDKSPLVEVDDNVKLLYAGRFDGTKDVTIVLDIYIGLCEVCPNITLYMAGDGHGLEQVLEVANQGVDVRYVGNLKQQELVKVYNSVDIYLSPHKTDTLGLSIVESMARGLPAVTADVGGPRSLVENGVNGFRCTTKEEYLEALAKLVRDRELRKKLGENAREFASRYFASNCARNMINEFENIVRR